MCNFVLSKSEDCKMKRNVLNLRDLGGLPLTDGKGQTPHGLYLRSGKLSVLTPEECKKLPKNLFNSKNLLTFAPAFKTTKHWRDGRVVDYSSLENYRTERYRGFESLSLRWDNVTILIFR